MPPKNSTPPAATRYLLRVVESARKPRRLALRLRLARLFGRNPTSRPWEGFIPPPR